MKDVKDHIWAKLNIGVESNQAKNIKITAAHITKRKQKIDPNQPFDSRVINFSDYCDVIKEQLEELRSLGGDGELERYVVEFDELTKIFERKLR